MANIFPCLEVQESPRIVVATISGAWLLDHTTPSWRIKKPKKGFQRMVKEERARSIAAAVLDQHRTLPNAIVLATDSDAGPLANSKISLPATSRFLVVDGQHRLWAQEYSDFSALYICVIHFGLDEKDMAELFIEINDNQKRVPSSLRWDLVRLVRPDDDPIGVRTSDLVYDLASNEDSPLFQRIDLTGEQHAISLKQGSVAPAVKGLLGSRSRLHEESYETQLKILTNYVTAMRERDADGWDKGTSPLYSARVFRATFRLLSDILDNEEKLGLEKFTAKKFFEYLANIDLDSLDLNEIRAQQGAAGMRQIYMTLRGHIFE